MSAPELPEPLVRFVEVVAEDEDLRAWLISFRETPETRRSEEFRRLAARMRAADEDHELVQATALLAHPEIFQAVWCTLKDMTDD